MPLYTAQPTAVAANQPEERASHSRSMSAFCEKLAMPT